MDGIVKEKIFDDEKKENESNKSFEKSLLDEDKSIISFYDDISLDDIKILPDELNNKNKE